MLENKPIEYKLLTAASPHEMNKLVNELLQHKYHYWMPLGPASISMNDSGSFKCYVQTLVRYA